MFQYCFLLLLLFVSALASAQIQVQDGTGQHVSLPREMRKVISLAPHTTELLYSAGAGSKIIATTEESDYPNASHAFASVGAYNQINLERIIALKPDLVVAWHDGGQQRLIDQLKHLGVAVFVSHPLTPSDIATEIHALGVLNGTPNIAKQNTAAFRQSLAKLQNQTNKPPVKSLFLVSFDPIYVMSNHSFLGKMMQLCGAENVFGDFSMPAVAINHEALLQQNAQIVFVSDAQSLPQWQQLFRHSPRRSEIHSINADLRPSLRIKSSLEQMCLIIEAKRHNRH